MGKKFDFDFVPFTYDQIREMNDDDLYKSITSFKRRIREALKVGKDTMPYEVEFCYLDHERIMRERSKAIQDKMTRNSREKFDRVKRNQKRG